MKLFLKHIWRSICKAPLQPLLICLAAGVSVAVCVAAFCLADLFAEHAAQQASLEKELGDILITPRADSDSHLLFKEDAAHVLGDGAKVFGEFAVSGFTERDNDTELLRVSAADLLAADDFYRFSYVEYDVFTTQNLNSAAILSTEAARRLGLRIGESFTVRIWESEHTYTVRAIAEPTGLLAQSDMLVSLTGLLQTLSARVPLLASLGKDFSPATRLMIRADGLETGEAYKRLLAAEAFSKASVTLSVREGQMDYMTTFQLVFVLVLLLLLLVLAAFVICTALAILHERRATEYAVFACAGASPAQIAALTYLESFVYALVCGALGVALSYPALFFAGGFYSWNDTPLRPGIAGTLLGFAASFLLIGLCTALHLHRVKRVDGQKRAARFVRILPLCLLIPMLVLCYSLPVAYRFYPCLLALPLAVWALFSLSPVLLRMLAGGAERVLARALPSLLLAVKNLHRHVMLRYVARLLAVLLALVLAILICAGRMGEQLETMTEELPFHFVVLGVDGERGAEIAKDPAVAASMHMIYDAGVELPNGTNAYAISFAGDLAACVPQEWSTERLPKGNEILLSEGLLLRSGCKVGDVLALSIGGVSRDFVIAGSMPMTMNCLYFDADGIGVEWNMLCIQLTEQARVDAGETERLGAVLESKGGIMAPAKLAFGALPDTLGGHLKLARFSVYIALLLGLSGCANVLVQQYDARRRERRILRDCGMTRATLCGMYLFELAFVALFAALCAAPTAALLCHLVDLGVRSFGIVLFL
ncbi:MAG: ABC transporter permease [Ruminococcaceae bacterium]|nr:ABC transporter permease [Oscillospiraceae bacterium]